MNDDALTVVDPTPEEIQYLEDRIYEFNSSATGIGDGRMLALFVRDGGRIVAGICGNTWGGTCELRQLWVEESRRHNGIGTKLLQAAEQEAARRGCTQIVLMTFSFQAPGFYEKNGFTVVARIDDHPSGHRNLLMHKVLAPGRFASWRPHPSAANTPNENVASVPGQPPWRSHDDGSH